MHIQRLTVRENAKLIVGSLNLRPTNLPGRTLRLWGRSTNETPCCRPHDMSAPQELGVSQPVY
jgi:hypothetical protein